MNDVTRNINAVLREEIQQLNEYTETLARTDDGWRYGYHYRFTDGTHATLSGDRMQYGGIVGFPASSPDFTLLEYVRPEVGDPQTEDIEAHVIASPIVGWLVHLDQGQTYVEAVTVTAVVHGHHNKQLFRAIQHPDGRIVRHLPWMPSASYLTTTVEPEAIFPDWAAWIADVRRTWAIRSPRKRLRRTGRSSSGSPGKRIGRGHRSRRDPSRLGKNGSRSKAAGSC